MNTFNVYPLWPIEPVKALGCKVWDSAGTEYLDMYGGHAVISIGHCHPVYNEMLKEQIDRISFYSNTITNSLQIRLAQELGEACGYPDYSLFLVNSGAESNENALKLASFHTGRDRILTIKKAFHGRTSAAVAVTDNPKIQAPINKSDKVTFIEMNDLEALEKELITREYCALIIEGIQGVGGIRLPDEDFWSAARKLCSQSGTLLIVDEIQSGYGRTGEFFAHSFAGIKADIITTAKGMGNGFPIGGVIISPDIKAEHGALGSTFGGSFLACTAALAVLKVIKEENLIENAIREGEYLINSLRDCPAIKEVRGRGLMIGFDIKEGYESLRNRLLFEKHIFTGAAGANTIRLLPPMIINRAESDHFLRSLNELTIN